MMLSKVMPSKVMLSKVMPSKVMLSKVMPSKVMLSKVMLSKVMRLEMRSPSRDQPHTTPQPALRCVGSAASAGRQPALQCGSAGLQPPSLSSQLPPSAVSRAGGAGGALGSALGLHRVS